MKKPEYDNAITHYKKAISFNKKYAKAHYNLALMYKIQRKFEDSRKHYEKAIEIVNDYSKAHFHLAMLLKETGSVAPNDKVKSSEDSKEQQAEKSKS